MQSPVIPNLTFPSKGSAPARSNGKLSQFFIDLGHEVTHELQLDTSDSDIFVKQHIGGMVIAMFSLIVVFIVISAGVVALFHNY